MPSMVYKRCSHCRLTASAEPAYTEPEYELRAIINESDDYYEVDWKPTWLLKAWVNQTAIDAWNNRQLELICKCDICP